MLLFQKITEFEPTLLIYHLGFDVLEIDRMGGIEGMDAKQLERREKTVKEFFNKLNVPYLIYRGGGYINYDADESTIKVRKERLYEIQMSAINYYIGN